VGGNSLQMFGEVYDIAKSMASIIVREFFVAIKKHLKSLVIPKLTKNKSKKLPLVLNTYMEFLTS
jgi:hypothetical protein